MESWRSPGDTEPSLSGPSPPHQARTMHFRDVAMVFSSAMSRNSTFTTHDPNEMDEIEKERRWPVRYLVAWLPWLSLLKYFHDEPAVDIRNRMSNHSGFSQPYEKMKLAQPPRRAPDIDRNTQPSQTGDETTARHDDAAES